MISETEIREALARSGYLLEQRVHRIFEAYDYIVNPNVAYPDEFTGKSRELDIEAMAVVDLAAEDLMFPVVLCSCINNSQPLAFFTYESMIPEWHHQDFKMSGLPVIVWTEQHGFVRLSEFLLMGRYHHYCKSRVATQYCSFAKKGKDKWYATHVTEHHDAMSGLDQALATRISEHYAAWQIDPENEVINIQLYYPVLVLQGELFEVQISGTEVNLESTEHLLFRRAYHSVGRQDDYFVDVVTESGLRQFLDDVDAEVFRMVRAIRRRKVPRRESIKKLVDRAGHRGRRSLRDAFEKLH